MKTRMIAIALASTLLLTGCPWWETLSWSPNGRYLAFVGPDVGKLWIWDTMTDEAAPSGWDDDRIVHCRFITDEDLVVFKLLEGSDDNSALWKGRLGDEPLEGLTEETTPWSYDVSPDGKYLYYVRQLDRDSGSDKDGVSIFAALGKDSTDAEGGSPEYALVQKHLRKRRDDKVLLELEEEPTFPKVAPSGSRISFFTENGENGGIHVLDLKTGKVTRVVTGFDRFTFYWPQWLDEDTMLSIRLSEKDAEGEEFFGTLVRHDLENRVTTALCKKAFAYDPPSLDEERTKAVVTVFTGDIEKDEDGESLGVWQLALVNIASGETRMLNEEPLGAGMAVLDPSGKRVAYTSPLEFGEATIIRILDLETNKTTTVWRNEAEQLLASGLDLEQDGESAKALRKYEEFLARFPDSPLTPHATYRTMLLSLEPDTLDLDRAFEIFDEIGTDELPEQINALFWREDDKVATDPAEDWIHTYGTEASREEFGFRTDLARDLRALWARWSAERLYLRIDYGSYRDVHGIAVQDTVVLFDHDSPDDGHKPFSLLAEWDRGAERQVIIRHWFEAGDNSQYDVEIRNATGEILSRFVGSGFSGAQCPHFALHDASGAWDDAPGSLVFSLSRDALGLEGDTKTAIQVCTFKGGIESHKGLERPRETPADEPPAEGEPVPCDVADAFGEQNTAERMKSSATVLGAAAILELVGPKPEGQEEADIQKEGSP